MKTLQRLFTILFLAGLSVSFALAQSNGDYQTAKSGNWNDISVWQVYNGSWGAATVTPDSNAGKISVLAGHTVNVTADVGVDSVFVESGGSIVVNAGVTLTVGYNRNRPNGLVLLGPNAMQVSGTLRNEGNLVGAKAPRGVDFDPAVDTLVVKNGGVINHARNAGAVPIAKWEEGSTFLVTGLRGNYFSSMPQNYYNIVWNCPNQTRGDGRLNMYRNRIRGDFVVESNGTQVGGDRDIRLCDSFPARGVYEDTVWFDGNIILKTPPAGQGSRLAISGGGNTEPIYILIVKGNVIVEDSCVFGRTNSNGENRLYLEGDLIVAGGGTIRTGQNNPYQQKIFVFNKQGTQKLAIGDGRGAWGYGYTVGGPLSFQVASGCLLDMGTSKIPSTTTGFFVIDNGGAVKVTYGANSGAIESTGENGVVDAEHDTLNGVPTANGNSFVFAKNVVGSGTITYAASAIQNVSDPAKAITRQWTVTPAGGIQSGNLDIFISPYDIPATANWKNFVVLKYSASGNKWENRGPVNFIIDSLFGDTTGVKGATVANVTDLGGVWSVGEVSLTTGVESKPAATIPQTFFVEQNYPNPFNPSTSITFGLPKASHVTVKVFSLLGQEVASILSGHRDAGTYTVPFNAADLSSGIYLYKVEAGNFIEVKRMILMK